MSIFRGRSANRSGSAQAAAARRAAIAGLLLFAVLGASAVAAGTVVIVNAKIAGTESVRSNSIRSESPTNKPTRLSDATVIVRGGKIDFVGSADAAPKVTGEAEIVDAQGRWLTPGLIVSDTQLGLVEIGAESTSADAQVTEFSMGPAFELRYALNPASVVFGITRAQGITAAVVTPSAGNDPLAGLGLAINLRSTLNPTELIISDRLALFGGLGPDAANFVGGSRSALLVRLREAFTAAKSFNSARYRPDDGGYSRSEMAALKRWLVSGAPLALEVNQASQILQAIELAQDYKLRLIVTGGVEAWKVRNQLAAADVPVVLDPLDNIPVDFGRLGARLDNAALLHEAGVVLAFRSENTYNAGWIRQGGGVAVANGLPFDAAIAAMTSGPAKIFGLRDRGTLAAGKVADLVLWSGDPLEVTTHAERVMIDGTWMDLANRQDRLLERYRDLSNTVTPYGFR